MIALGNDVIDLAEKPRNGAKYYRRMQSYAFAQEELAQFQFKRDVPESVAIGWSIKEAAYKSVVKLIGKERIAPRDFFFEITSEAPARLTCVVHHRDLVLHAETALAGGYVHTVSFLPNAHAFVLGVGISLPDYQSQSINVRTLALQSMTCADAIAKNKEGVPYFERAGERMVNELSLSHHGRWVAFAYQS